jgi:predicted nucleotidyltransferase
MAADPKLVEALQKALRSRKDVRLALLFGSQARGKARGDSDVDLAIEGDVNTLALISELSDATGREVDVVELRRAGYPLLKALLRDGIVLHEAARGIAADWRTRAMFQVEVDRPGWERMRDAFLERLAEGRHG